MNKELIDYFNGSAVYIHEKERPELSELLVFAESINAVTYEFADCEQTVEVFPEDIKYYIVHFRDFDSNFIYGPQLYTLEVLIDALQELYLEDLRMSSSWN